MEGTLVLLKPVGMCWKTELEQGQGLVCLLMTLFSKRFLQCCIYIVQSNLCKQKVDCLNLQTFVPVHVQDNSFELPLIFPVG